MRIAYHLNFALCGMMSLQTLWDIWRGGREGGGREGGREGREGGREGGRGGRGGDDSPTTLYTPHLPPP